MTTYTIERTYWVPIFQHVTLEAETPEAAMRAALEHDDWASAETCYDDSRAEHITGAWEGEDDYSGPDLPIPAEFQPGLEDAPGNALDEEQQRLYFAAPEMRETLRGLLAWAERTGGWDAPIWQQAARLVGASTGEPCPTCDGKGAFPASGDTCDDCAGGGVVIEGEAVNG